MYNKEKMIYHNEQEEMNTENMKENEPSKTENIYETVKFLVGNLINELQRSKEVYMFKYDNCEDYDKAIFERIYNKIAKHSKILEEYYTEMCDENFDYDMAEKINHKKYNSEKCIMDQYDLLDDYTRIYANLDNRKHKDMINEIIQDTQKNMILLTLVYMGEE